MRRKNRSIYLLARWGPNVVAVAIGAAAAVYYLFAVTL